MLSGFYGQGIIFPGRTEPVYFPWHPESIHGGIDTDDEELATLCETIPKSFKVIRHPVTVQPIKIEEVMETDGHSKAVEESVSVANEEKIFKAAKKSAGRPKKQESVVKIRSIK